MTGVAAVLAILRDVSLPSLRAHRLRTVLTLLGIVLATQMVVAIRLISRSVVESFQRTAATIAGTVDYQLSNGSAGVPEELVYTIAAVPGVASASGLAHGTFTTAAGELTVFGVDLFADQELRDTQFPLRHVHIPYKVEFANLTDSIAVSTPFLERAKLEVGDSFDVTGPTGTHRLVVRGSLDPVGPAALYGGAIALVDLPTLQTLGARPGLVDQIDVRLRDGVSVESAREPLLRVTTGVGTLATPRSQGANLSTMLDGVDTILTLASLNAVVIGAFLVYHTMQSSILQRRRELALVRAVGFRRTALGAALLAEAAIFGVVGAVMAIVSAAAVARLALGLVGAAVATIYARADMASVALSGWDIAIGLGLGVGSALAGAVAPVREAARLSVTEQLAGVAHSASGRRASHGAAFVGVALAAAGFMIFWSDVRPGSTIGRVGLIMAGVVLAAVGYALLAPTLLRALVAPALPLCRRLRGAGAAIALENATRAQTRSGGTLAAIMLAFALVLIVGAFVASLRGTILGWIEQSLGADLYVGASAQLPLPSGPTLRGDVEDVVRGVDGVAATNATRTLNVPFRGHVVVLKTQHAGATRIRIPIVAGTSDASFADGTGVFVSDNLAYRYGVRAGDHVELDTPSGRRRFGVSAVVSDYTSDLGTITVERDAYRRIWRDDALNTLLVWAEPGADIDRLRAQIRAAIGSRRPITILTGREFGGQVSAALDAALLLTYAMQLVAMGVAVLAVTNFFLAETTSRRREIGLLRSVALDPRQLVGSFVVEAAVLGAVGGVLAVLYGWPLSYAMVTRATRLVSGWRLSFDFPAALVPLSIGLAVLTAMAGAYLPARRAARVRVAELVAME
jgi:putative ABC transport system permease protein